MPAPPPAMPSGSIPGFRRARCINTPIEGTNGKRTLNQHTKQVGAEVRDVFAMIFLQVKDSCITPLTTSAKSMQGCQM